MATTKTTTPKFGDAKISFHVAGNSGQASHHHKRLRPSCGNLSRWVLQRCSFVCRNMARTRIFMLAVAIFCVVIVSLSVSVDPGGDGPDFAAMIQRNEHVQDLQHAPIKVETSKNVSNSSKVLSSSHVNETRHKPTSKALPIPPPKKASPAPANITALISEFAKVYAYNFSEDNEKFFAQVKEITGKKWEPNVERTEKFRSEIRATLGEKGKSENVYLTKHSTPKKSPMIFYMAGKRSNISDGVWNTLPNESVFRPDRFSTCSVVGSSGLLYKSQCGKRIDDAGFVVRFNLAPVKGFQADVGSKTNFTSLNPTFIMRKMNSLRHPDNYTLLDEALGQFRHSLLYLPGFAVSGSLKLLIKTATVVRELKVAQPIYGSPYHFLAVATLWRKALDMGLKWPSTGLYAISALFDACDRVNVYGFWPFKKSLDGNDVPYHYHNKVRGTAVHKFDKEFKMLLHLHDLGIIHLQLHPC